MMTSVPLQQSSKTQQQVKDGSLFFQPRLTINQPDDIYEQEADAMADRVMRMNEKPGDNFFFKPAVSAIQRKCRYCEEEEKKLQRKEDGKENHAPASSTENYIHSLPGGRPLDESERRFFEPKFGYDFSGVQLHTDGAANESAKNINALAYTHGSHIVFGASQYQPGTAEGDKLMAHELTHVVQQKSAERSIQRKVDIEDCENEQQRLQIEQADAKAVAILNKVTRILGAKLSAGNQAIVDDLAFKYFKVTSFSAGQTATLLRQYKNILGALSSDAYTYECEDGSSWFDGCSGSTLAYVFPAWTNIHLCMNILKNRDTNKIAETIIHEISHAENGTDDLQYCDSDCAGGNVEIGPFKVPFEKVSMANADSYSNFALHLYLRGS